MAIINPYDTGASQAGQAPISLNYPVPEASKVDTGMIASAMPAAAKVDQSSFSNTTPAAQTSGQGYTATTGASSAWDVSDPQTVYGQVNKITAEDGVLSQAAQTRAAQAANAKGLINTSMAVQSGQQAVIDSALPIAQADANTYAAAARRNADAVDQMTTFNAGQKNAAGQFGASAANSASSQNAQAANALQSQQLDNKAKAALTDAANRQQVGMAGYDTAVKAALQNADAQTKLQLQGMDTDTRAYLANVEANYKLAMQSSAAMTDTYQAMVNNISSIMANKDLDADGKQAAIDHLTKLHGGAMAVQEAVSGLQLGTLISADALGQAGTAPVAAGAPAPVAAKAAATTPTKAPAPTPAQNYWVDPNIVNVSGGTGG